MTQSLKKWIGGLALLGAVLAAVPMAQAKDAPKPKDPPSDWRKYIFEDIKAPQPRPKSQSAGNQLGLKGSSRPTAKDAPKPTDPPSDWRKYIFEDIKAPKPRPKSQSAGNQLGLKGSSTPVAKDAPKPTDPPSDWRKYVFEDIKAPAPRPKGRMEVDPRDPFGRPKKIGFPPPQTRQMPRQSTQGASKFPPKQPPYTHPRDFRDFKDKKGPKGPRY